MSTKIAKIAVRRHLGCWTKQKLSEEGKKLGDLMGDKSVSRWRANSRKSVALSRDQLDSIDLCVINDRKLNN
jgi:hypothetical protein